MSQLTAELNGSRDGAARLLDHRLLTLAASTHLCGAGLLDHRPRAALCASSTTDYWRRAPPRPPVQKPRETLVKAP